jgi:hypothetical protein
MKLANKTFSAMIVLTCMVLAACSGIPGGNNGGGTGGGGTTGSFTIGGAITGLTGTGLVLSDNGTDTLTVATATTKFTFKTAIANGGKYTVTVTTQPSNPAQTCAVTSGSGTASANVTSVAVTCTTNPVTATIGGTISGLATGASVIVQDNGGDSLTLTANGAFTFKTAVTGPTDAYAVTVNTQPSSPNQICRVTNGSGTATANVTNVAVNCVLSYTIGGTVTGVLGTGFVLQDSVTPPGGTTPTLEQLPISAASGNQSFAFKTFLPTGSSYTVTIATQPSNPVQTCVVTAATASGTVSATTGNISNVTVNCPAVTFEVSGTTYGLAGVPTNNGILTDNSFSVHINTANTLHITQNGPFQFATPEALNDAYFLEIDHAPSTQFQGCTRWNPQGFVTQNITDLELDCGHNDWTYTSGGTAAGTETPVSPIYGQLVMSIPTAGNYYPNPYTNTPGSRYGGAGWTDKHGSLFLFGGYGWELSGAQHQDTLPAEMNDLWVCVAEAVDECQWQLVGSYIPTVSGSTTVGALVEQSAQSEGQGNSYGPFLAPPARKGAATWTDTNGNLWLFGGARLGHFLSDLWKLDTSVYDGTWQAYTTKNVTWNQVAGSNFVDQGGVYPPAANPYPGAREYPVSWTDTAGNFWLFGGYGYDGSGSVGFLNDLWEYTGGHWVFKSGSATASVNQLGIYGTQGTAATTNMPGGRQEAVGWVDKSGTVLWLFGGEGEDATGTTNGILNDLWMYDIPSGKWTFVLGSTAANQTGVYPVAPLVGPVNTTNAAGTCGLSIAVVPCTPVSEAGAFPGSRWGAAGWADAGGDLWLFGGWGLNSTATNGNGALNDLWVYTPSSTAGQPGTWAWIKGSNTGAAGGNYGSLDRPYETHYTYTPGGRSLATAWHYYNPNIGPTGLEQFWLFGGEGYDAADILGTPRTPTNGILNDQWRYLPYQDY